MKLLKIAWRNLWRSPKRTLITIASVFFGVFCSIGLSSLQDGSFNNMVDNMVSFTTGYAQLQTFDYKESGSINDGFIPDEGLVSLLENNEYLEMFTPRLNSFALAASGEESYGTSVMGVDFKDEDRISDLSQWIIEGEYAGKDSTAVLLGDILAKRLKLGVGDTVALIGQGYHGVQAAGLYRVGGLIQFPISDLNKQILYMDIKAAGELFQAPGLISNMVLMVNKPTDVPALVGSLGDLGDMGLAVFSWEELLPELVQFIDGKTSSGKIFKAILFLIIAFGILGTFIMMIAERKRELGVMIALGMSRFRLSLILFIESILIGGLGVVSSFLITMPIVGYFVNNPIEIGGEMGELYGEMGFEPILMFSGEADVFTSPAVAVFFISVIIAFYPVLSVIRMDAVRAIRGI